MKKPSYENKKVSFEYLKNMQNPVQTRDMKIITANIYM